MPILSEANPDKNPRREASGLALPLTETDHLFGTPQLNSEGYAVAQTANVPVGSYSISAAYSGDASYKASTSSSVPFTVTPTSTTVSVTPSSAGVAPNTEITLTTIVNTTSQGTAPTGNVELFVNGTQASTIGFDTVGNTDANGFAESIERTGFRVGASTETLTAVFVPDDGNYLGSTSSPVTIAVGALTLSLSPAPNTATLNVIPGQPANQTIMVTETFVAPATVELSCAVTPRTSMIPILLDERPLVVFSDGYYEQSVCDAHRKNNGAKLRIRATTPATSAERVENG